MHQKMILEHHKVELAVEEVEEVLSLVIAVVHESLVVRRYLRGRCDDVRLAGPPKEFSYFRFRHFSADDEGSHFGNLQGWC